MLTITMKYSPERARTISGLRRVSKPGLRVYTKADEVPRVLGGLGVAVAVHQPGAHDRPRGAQAARSAARSSATSGEEARCPASARPPSPSPAASTSPIAERHRSP